MKTFQVLKREVWEEKKKKPIVSLRSKLLLAHFYEASDLETFTGKENTNTVDHTELTYGSMHQCKVDTFITSTCVTEFKENFLESLPAPVEPSFPRRDSRAAMRAASRCAQGCAAACFRENSTQIFIKTDILGSQSELLLAADHYIQFFKLILCIS